MSSGRDTVLGAVRRALGGDHARRATEATADRARRIGGPPPRPVWTEDRRERFLARLERSAATWRRVADAGGVPEAVAEYLRNEGVTPVRLRVAPHPLFQDLQWPDDWEVAEGVAGDRDWLAGIAIAYAGIAETGSLVMPSGPERPTSLNFLPDFHIVVLRASDVVDYMEEVWARLQREHGDLPRTVNVITGPSRTGDVEQIIQLGAHGPRRLHVLLLD